MLSFKTFLDEDTKVIGYGNNPLDFYENLSSPSHIFESYFLEEDTAKKELKKIAVTVEPGQKDPTGGGGTHTKIKEGAEAAFPEGESESERAEKHKESVAHWQEFKREYEKNVNAQRENENKDIATAKAHVDGLKPMSDNAVSNMLSSHEANRAHNILARGHAEGKIKLSDSHINSIMSNPNATDAQNILKNAHIKGKIKLSDSHINQLKDRNGELTKTNINANLYQPRKKLTLGYGTSLLTSNGKYAPEKHEGGGETKGVKIKGLALSPNTVAGGMNQCPKASEGCSRECLALRSGMNQGEERNYHLKIAKSQFLQRKPEHAVRMISKEIDNHESNAKKNGLEPAIRLNANSDINWEKVLPHKFWNRHKNTQFYDYTKIASRVDPKNAHKLPSNYHLTLSSTGTGHDESNDSDVSKHLDNGGNAAIVFRTRDKKQLPHTVVVHHFDGSMTAHPAHNANERDDRYNDEIHYASESNKAHKAFLKANPHIKPGKGKVSALTFKGNTDAEMKNSEFAVDTKNGVAHIKGD